MGQEIEADSLRSLLLEVRTSQQEIRHVQSALLAKLKQIDSDLSKASQLGDSAQKIEQMSQAYNKVGRWARALPDTVSDMVDAQTKEMRDDMATLDAAISELKDQYYGASIFEQRIAFIEQEMQEMRDFFLRIIPILEAFKTGRKLIRDLREGLPALLTSIDAIADPTELPTYLPDPSSAIPLASDGPATLIAGVSGNDEETAGFVDIQWDGDDDPWVRFPDGGG